MNQRAQAREEESEAGGQKSSNAAPGWGQTSNASALLFIGCAPHAHQAALDLVAQQEAGFNERIVALGQCSANLFHAALKLLLRIVLGEILNPVNLQLQAGTACQGLHLVRRDLSSRDPQPMLMMSLRPSQASFKTLADTCFQGCGLAPRARQSNELTMWVST